MPPFEVYSDHRALFQAAAEHFSEIANSAVAAHGIFFVALAGGNTPRELYLLLAQPAWRSRVPWEKAHIFFGDERCVPPEHPDSNYRMAREVLLEALSLPEQNIHRMAGEQEPHAAALAYQQEIRRVFSIAGDKLPRFDLILLGLGSDGHTASLFPGTAALHEKEKLVVANYVDKLNSFRLTLTLPVLNNAQHIMFLAVGDNKANILHEIFEMPDRPIKYPAELVRPTNGTVIWLLDRAAANKLQSPTA